MEVLGLVGDALYKLVEVAPHPFLAKIELACYSRPQKGFALLLVLLLLSLMVVLVFSVSYRSTLDAREFHFRYLHLQKQEIVKSCVNVCSAWIKTKPSAHELKFSIKDTEVMVKLLRFDNVFNINDLFSNLDRDNMIKFDEALNQDKLSLYKENIINLVQLAACPWVNIEDLYQALSPQTADVFIPMTRALSVHPNGSLRLDVELNFFDGTQQKKILYYYPSPSGHILVSQLANNDAP